MVGFITESGSSFAGRHLLIDFYDCQNHGSLPAIQDVMERACRNTGATILFTHLHPFTGGGCSGAVILAESHMSIHTWPENRFISLDIFVCGDCDPHRALPVLEEYFRPGLSKVSLEHRGVMPTQSCS